MNLRNTRFAIFVFFFVVQQILAAFQTYA